MSIKSKRKGFTIVELVIVIAVIAILAAVLIPVFAGLINKAELSADQALVRNLNTSLALSSGAGEKQNETMYDTLEDIKKAGYVVENLTPTKNGNEILWDKQENQFVLVIKNKDGSVKEYYTGTTKCDYTTVETSNFWKIYKEMPTGQKYSIYLAGNEFVGTVDVSGVGFDAGLNKVSVNYLGGESKSSVIIRTYFGDLTVDAETDDVKHYGIAKNLIVKNVNKENCYHEYGYVYEVKTGFVSGKFVAEKTSVFHQSRADVEPALAVAENENKSFESKLGAKYGEHYFVNNKCVFCDADITPSKNGLSNGLYYENGELKTGSVTDEDTGKTYTFEDGRLVIDVAKEESGLSTYVDYSLTYSTDVPEKYKTKEMVLLTKNTLDKYVGKASAQPGNYTATKLTITGAENDNYVVKNIGISYSKGFKGAIDYLAQNIGEKTKSELLETLKNTYGFDETFYPLMTKSDDFVSYLNKLKEKGIISETTISDSNYETIQNSEYTFATFLKEKYSVSSILALSWTAKVNCYDGFHGGWPNSSNKINGIFAGDVIRQSGNDCFFNDPEIILLYLKHTYDNILFTGISSNKSKAEKLLSDMYKGAGDIYSFGDSNWMESASATYGVEISSLYKLADGIDLSKLSNKSEFYMFTASHQWLMTNMYQDREFVAPIYKIIIENTNN